MSENIASRVGRIISGGFNAIVDAMENAAPETVMEQAIREIDDAISQVRTELGKQIANKHLVSKRIAQENEKHEDLSEKIELAVKEDRDELAEAGISKQLDIEAQIPILEQSLAECSGKEKELEGYVLALQAKKREMQDELKAYKDSVSEAPMASSSDGNLSNNSKVGSKVDHAASTFERVLARQTGLRSVGSSTDSENAAKLADLEDISRKNRIKERLLAAKSELGKE
ncbi:hypothetical protein BVY02_01740 [bacterium J17]|nr:hypothetical protein BVY02_01740 [bacterium J17]